MLPAGSAEEAVRGADIVLCATNSLDPVFFEDWIEPGMHLGAIRDGEIEPAAIAGCDVALLHDPASIDTGHYQTTHGLRIPDQEKETASNPALRFLAEAPTIFDLIAGKTAGRSDAHQTTCFLNLRGLAVQFTAVGAALYEKARQTGRGRDLPTEWFTENVHP
jgi:ornithine cyclodeaminase/alanine dehydrogenase-like protein (mu-crystallin family)